MRPNTERPITVTKGTKQLCVLKDIEEKVSTVLLNKIYPECDIGLWDGETASYDKIDEGTMGNILINIKDKSKENMVLNLLRELSFIEFKELGKTNKIKKTSDFRKLFGIWKSRTIELHDLRQKAWQRKTS